jgi:nitroimidazol reductase NimA-like FMN-containing flavoprotein (pyridoxamine 5'-phosphate oxidase superfamily)
VNDLPHAVWEILERGEFCHVAALTRFGPHVTPTVFAVAGGRVWVTTSRRSVKARAWRADPRAAGLVRAGDDAVVFTGTATTHDVLDPSTWARTVISGGLVSVAAARFTRKNARFFAGYAVDARKVPLAWTPPGRVFVEITLDRAAVLEGGRPSRGSDGWVAGGAPPPSSDRFRAARAGDAPLARLPEGIRAALGRSGLGALAMESAGGPVVIPAAWTVAGAGLYAVASEATLALADPPSAAPRVSLGIDRPSVWRARNMVGAMARGVGAIHVAHRLVSGGRSARAVAETAGIADEDVAVVTIRPDRVVWWRGWESGTVSA